MTLRGEYFGYRALRTFLDRLDYVDIAVPWVVGRLQCSCVAGTTLSILDIGGGDGRFTSRLLTASHLIDRVADLIVVDPSFDALREYERSIVRCAPLIRMECIPRSWERDEGFEGRFSLVVASHSLYGVLEGADAHSQQTKIQDVFDCANEQGLVYISLAAQRSPAYVYKAEALRILSEANPSVFGESILEFIPAGWAGEVEVFPSSMRLPPDWQTDQQAFAAFNEYFLRIERSRLTSDVCSQLWRLWNEIGAQTWTGQDKWCTGMMRHAEVLQFYRRKSGSK